MKCCISLSPLVSISPSSYRPAAAELSGGWTYSPLLLGGSAPSVRPILADTGVYDTSALITQLREGVGEWKLIC